MSEKHRATRLIGLLMAEALEWEATLPEGAMLPSVKIELRREPLKLNPISGDYWNEGPQLYQWSAEVLLHGGEPDARLDYPATRATRQTYLINTFLAFAYDRGKFGDDGWRREDAEVKR